MIVIAINHDDRKLVAATAKSSQCWDDLYHVAKVQLDRDKLHHYLAGKCADGHVTAAKRLERPINVGPEQ